MSPDDSTLLPFPHRPAFAAEPRPEPAAMPLPEDDGMDLFRKLWRHKGMILGAAVLGGALATGVGMTMTPRYTAETQVLLGIAMPRVTDIPSLLGETAANQDAVQSESYVIRSRSIGTQVAHRLALDQDPEFNPALRPKPAWKRSLGDAETAVKNAAKAALAAVGLAKPHAAAPAPGPSAEQRKARRDEAVVTRLLSRLQVTPLQRSHVLSITAQSENPDTAARIANTVARTYIEQQMIRRTHVTADATQWLNQQIAALRGKVETAERAAEEYRRQNGLYQTRNDQVTAQQVAEINTQLVMAESQEAAAEARLAQVERVERNKQSVDSLPAVVNSPMIQALVQRKVEAERQAADLSATLGPEHPKMLDIRAQIADLKQRIANEVQRVIQALRHEVDATRGRVQALQANLAKVQSQLGNNNEKMIHLRELERQADANRRLLVSFLDREKETQAQPNIDDKSSAVISKAAIPLAPSYPPKNVLRLLGIIGGALIGMVIALFRENLDRTFRTPRQVEEATRLPILGILPPWDASFVPGMQAANGPASPFGQAMDNLCERLIFAPASQTGRSVMLTSATPREGKSKIAMALARLASRQGRRAIVLDCDWRRPTLDNLFAQAATPGLGDLLTGRASPDDVVYRDPVTGAHAIFAGDISRLTNKAERYALLGRLLDTLTRHYDLVIVDTPPVMVSPDAFELAHLAEEVAFVVRWGTNPRDVVVNAIRNLSIAGPRFGGIILSDVDPKRYRRYGMGDVVYPYAARPASRVA